MNYYQVAFTFSPLQPIREIFYFELAEIGYESFEDLPEGLVAYITETLFDEKLILQLVEQYNLQFKISWTSQFIAKQNWNANWEANFSPIEINQQLLIRAPFHSPDPSFPLEVIIQPQMSFGTGHHETTYLIAERLLTMNLAGQSLLDMGCGTAVLAILASKLKAEPVLAIDNDDWAVENSKENCTLNNISNVIVEKGDASKLHSSCFNIILANINRNVLIADMEVYFNALLSEGYLLLSGFFSTDVELIRNYAEKLGLTFVSSFEKNNWAMLEFKK